MKFSNKDFFSNLRETADLVIFIEVILNGKLHFFVQCKVFSSLIFLCRYFFNDINHGYRAAILKKNSLWLLPLYMVVAIYFDYEKVSRKMRTVIVSSLLK